MYERMTMQELADAIGSKVSFRLPNASVVYDAEDKRIYVRIPGARESDRIGRRDAIRYLQWLETGDTRPPYAMPDEFGREPHPDTMIKRIDLYIGKPSRLEVVDRLLLDLREALLKDDEIKRELEGE